MIKNTKLNKNFNTWFAKSIVKTKTENPIVCYHGTWSFFKTFNKKKIGQNHWQSKEGFFFVDKKNNAINHAKKFNHKKSVWEIKNVIPVYLKILNPYVFNSNDYYGLVDKYDLQASDIIKRAKEKGYDGIVGLSNNGNLYIVFEPNQIKNINNFGKWSLKNDNIYL